MGREWFRERIMRMSKLLRLWGMFCIFDNGFTGAIMSRLMSKFITQLHTLNMCGLLGQAIINRAVSEKAQ